MEMPMEKRVTRPVVSVVVPIHNAEKFLKKCLDSICGQTLENIEIICIDDGCTDGSLKILSDFTSKDGRIRVFSQEASNAGHARNVGMEKASGEFLSFLDADDWFEKEMLNSMVALAKRENADIVFCKAKTYDQRTGRQSEKSFSLRERLVPRKKTFSVWDIDEDLFQFCRTAVWDRLYRTDFIRGERIRFQEQPRMNDCYFSLLANLRAKRIAVCNRFFVHYRINSGSSITSISPDIAYTCSLNAFGALRRVMTEKERKFFRKSWENYLLKTIVNEISTFSVATAYSYYCLLKRCDVVLFDLTRFEVYDPFAFRMYTKYLKKDWSEEAFPRIFEKFLWDYRRQKRRSNIVKSLNGVLPLLFSHRLKSLWLQLRNMIGL